MTRVVFILQHPFYVVIRFTNNEKVYSPHKARKNVDAAIKACH